MIVRSTDDANLDSDKLFRILCIYIFVLPKIDLPSLQLRFVRAKLPTNVRILLNEAAKLTTFKEYVES